MLITGPPSPPRPTIEEHGGYRPDDLVSLHGRRGRYRIKSIAPDGCFTAFGGANGRRAWCSFTLDKIKRKERT